MENFQLSSLDNHFADFIVRIEGRSCEGLWLAAALASSMTARGHVCLDLHVAAGCLTASPGPAAEPARAPEAGDWLKQLSCCSTVGRPGEYAPLVLDGSGRLYLHRSWDAERKVAEGIQRRCSVLASEKDRLTARLDRYFPAVDGGTDHQREAARTALTSQFTVITGGPGTGKTTTVARILALLIEQAGTGMTIRAAAPTGKAAMRLQQSLAQAASRLSLRPEVREYFPRDVSTIHRLLGVLPGRPDFRHNRNNPLPCDLLVVDEASMIDLTLMARLLEALTEKTRVILLGDSDQLASVEAGAVLADICAGPGNAEGATTERPAIVHLTKSYRFSDESGIGRLSRLINAGDGRGALDLLTSGLCDDAVWCENPPAESFAESFMATTAEGYAGVAAAQSPEEALAGLERFRVLAAHREGPHGIIRFNALIETALRQQHRPGGSALQPKAVMVAANSYELELFNGDTGVMVNEGDAGWAAYFLTDETAAPRRVSALRLPPHEAAFAQTVHKTQGSEFDTVLLVLPDKSSELLCRELLYTAVTRARQRIEIWGTAEIFIGAVERRTERYSGLRDRLWNAGES